MAKQPQSGERSFTFDDPIFIGIVCLATYITGWAIWFFWHTPIAAVYGYWRYVEFYVINLIGELGDIPGISRVHAWLGGLCAPDNGVGLCTRDFSTVTWSEISDSSLYINVLLLLCLIAYCIRLFKIANGTHPKLKFSRSHNIKSFVNEQMNATGHDGKLLYPHLRVFSTLNLIVAPLDHPVFGMSQTSRQFAFKNLLISGWKEEGPGFWAPTLDREKAAVVLRAQLGKHWTSSANLSPAETLIIAIAMPRVAATDSSLDDKSFKKAMQDSEDMIAYCWSQFVPVKAGGKEKVPEHAWLTPAIDLAIPRQIIGRYIGTKAVQSIIERHAFNRTVLFGLMLQARRLGVLQPAAMRWLRFYDRSLWYVVQTIGRQAGFAEASGVLSHFLYEAKCGTGLVEPQLDKAVNGIEAAINNFKFSSDDKARYESQVPKVEIATENG
jgi:intracellular multiplication protein IcmP